MMRTPTHIIINDDVLAREDFMEIIDPVWWSGDFSGDVENLDRSLAPFSIPQRLVWAVAWYFSEVWNGGHSQFFDNSTGMVWPEALEGLRKIGRSDLEEVLAKALDRFDCRPSRDHGKRQEQASNVAFDGLDEDVWGILRANPVGDDIVAYIQQNRSDFYFDGFVNKPRKSGAT